MTSLVAGPLADFATPTFERGPGRPEKYMHPDGKRVPANTTIADRVGSKRGLYWWHWNNGHEGREYGDGGDHALDIGSLVHKVIEAELNGDTPPEVPDVFRNPVTSAVASWHAWLASTKLELIATEIPLVSAKHRFGGTLDTIVRDTQGRLAIGDWKSSKALYSNYLVQMAGYRILWNENRPEPITGGFHLVRFSKTHGDMEHRYFPELDDAEKLFLVAREFYELEKLVEARVK